MDTILVATDGSDHARRALDLAADIAAKFDSDLIIVHVTDTNPLSDSERHLANVEFADRLAHYRAGLDPEPMEGFKEAGIRGFLRRHDDRDAAIKKILGEAILADAKSAAQTRGARVIDTVLEDGDAAQKITAVAHAGNVDLIVLGTRGMNSVGELVLGSVSHKVSHLAGVSVLTVK